MEKVRIVCISDTHNHAPGEGYTLPKGDILIHAGDLTNQGSYAELKKAVSWISKADFAVKIIVAGNHDLSLDPNYSLKHEDGWNVLPADVEACRQLLQDNPDFIYLQHSTVEIRLPGKDAAIRVFGSPYSPDRGTQNWAFQYEDSAASKIWESITEDIDILITHTPPAEICDTSKHWRDGGCPALSSALSRIRPRLHVFGHCHEGRGAALIQWSDEDASLPSFEPWNDPGHNNKKMSKFDLTGIEAGGETGVVNASIMGSSHGRGAKAFNKPIVVDIDFERKSASTTSIDAAGSNR